MKIEIFYIAECPSLSGAVQLVRDVLAAQGVAADIQEVLVRDEEVSGKLSFLGSPTIRINGKDVAENPQTEKSFALSCRLYLGSKQIGLPPVEQVQRAILQAQHEERR